MPNDPYTYLTGLTSEDFTIEPKEEEIVKDDIVTDTDSEQKEDIEKDDLIKGTENFGYYPIMNATNKDSKDNNPKMGPIDEGPKNDLHIRTSDRIHYRVYFNANQLVNNKYVNKFCRFLDDRKSNERVTLFMGCHHSSDFTLSIGAILSAIKACAAHTHAVAAGLCGTPETFYWMFCKSQEVRCCGGLIFDGVSIIEFYPFYEYFLKSGFNKAISMGILTQEEVDALWINRNEFYVSYDRLKSKFGNSRR